MPRSLFALSAALMLLAAPAFAQTMTYDLPAFSKISISSGIEAHVTEGPAQEVRVEAYPADVLDTLRVEVQGDELVVRRMTSQNGWFFNLNIFAKRAPEPVAGGRAVFFISLPVLDGISARSGSLIEANHATGDTVSLKSESGSRILLDDLDAERLSILVRSGSHISTSGTCEMASIAFNSGSHFFADDLTCANVTVEGNSASMASISAEGHVTGRLNAGSILRLLGEPASVDVDTRSGARLTRD